MRVNNREVRMGTGSDCFGRAPGMASAWHFGTPDGMIGRWDVGLPARRVHAQHLVATPNHIEPSQRLFLDRHSSSTAGGSWHQWRLPKRLGVGATDSATSPPKIPSVPNGALPFIALFRAHDSTPTDHDARKSTMVGLRDGFPATRQPNCGL